MSSEEQEPETYSLVLRLRRVTYEDAYVAVPVTRAIVIDNGDGTYATDFDAFVAEALRIGTLDGVDWQKEESKIEPHEIQGPIPEGRRLLDSFFQLEDDDGVEDRG